MEITKEEFEAYKKVQSSGVTNMFNVSVVGKLSGLSREQILEIMKNYSEIEKEIKSTNATKEDAIDYLIKFAQDQKEYTEQ